MEMYTKGLTKFRIFDKKTKKIFYDAVITIQKGNISVKAGDTLIENFNIEQFTNLKDKNGIEIYEGDTIIIKNHLGIVVKSFGSYRIQFLSIVDGISYGWDDVEVINNPGERKWKFKA